MCLTVSLKSTLSDKKRDEFIAYKVYRLLKNGKGLKPPFWGGTTIAKPGVIVAREGFKNVKMHPVAQGSMIDPGIHVYRNRSAIARWQTPNDRNYITIPVSCSGCNVIGSNRYELALTKVTITKKDWNDTFKAINEKKGKKQ